MVLSAAIRLISGATQSSGKDAARVTPAFLSCSWIRSFTSMIGVAVFSFERRRLSDDRPGRDNLDLDKEFGTRKTADDHQSRCWRRVADEPVAGCHIAFQMLAPRDEGIDPHDIRKPEA